MARFLVGGDAGFPPLPVQQPSFVLVPAAPDPEFLVGGQGVYQAGLPYRAGGADRLGPLDSRRCWAGRPDRKEQLATLRAGGGRPDLSDNDVPIEKIAGCFFLVARLMSSLPAPNADRGTLKRPGSTTAASEGSTVSPGWI